MDVVLRAIEGRTFQGRQLANLAWAIATLGADEPEVLNNIWDDCLRLDVREFKPQEMTNLVWALATVGEPLPTAEFQGFEPHQEDPGFWSQPLFGLRPAIVRWVVRRKAIVVMLQAGMQPTKRPRRLVCPQAPPCTAPLA